ncbi:MAG: omptin family outer membrane protease [Treponema sp.]
MKKSLLICSAVLIFFNLALAAEEKTSSVTIEPFTSIKYGKLGEYVYDTDSNGDLQKLSYLEWEVKPLVLAGLNASAKTKNITIAYNFLSYGVPLSSGNMYDSDWMALTDMKTNYSISENTLNHFLQAGCNVNYTFKTNTIISITPGAGFDFSSISFSARNGYGWYGDYERSTTHENISWNSPYAKYYASGELMGIDYSRETFYTWLGFSANADFNKYFSLSFSAYISPYTFVSSIDKHFSNSTSTVYTAYNDLMDCYFSYFKTSLASEVNFSKNFSLCLNVNCLIGESAIGITYSKYVTPTYEGTKSLLSSKSKSDTFELEASLSCRIRFF